MQNISYLFEMTRWKKEAINNNLSLASHKRLTKAGVKKPVADYLTGFNRGLNNILNTGQFNINY